MTRRRTPGWWGLALALVGAAAPLAGLQTQPTPDPASRLTGLVTRTDGSPLAHAWVRVRTGAGVLHDLADAEGWYGMEVPPGRMVLQVEYIAHRSASVEVQVPAGALVRVDVQLEEQPLDLPGFVVRGEPFSVPPPTPRSVRPVRSVDPAVEVAALALDAGLAEVATAAAQARERDGQPPADGAQVLLMRGSTADLKLLLLDGAPVYTPFHLGGILESFDTDVLGRAAHYVGGAPARYDGGIDYILDLTTRTPSAPSLEMRGAIDLLSARGSGEWAREGGGLLASGRILHGAGARLLESSGNPYGYADGLVRGGWRFGDVDIGLTGFANRESVSLGLPDAPLVPDEAAWSNRALSARANHRLGPVAFAWTAAASRYDAALPLRTDSSVTTPRNPVLAEGRTGRQRAALDASLDGGSATLRFGLSLDRTVATYGSSLRTPTGYARTDARSVGRAVGAHGEVAGGLGRVVTARLGLRVDHFDPGGTRGAVRGALFWAVSPDAVLSLAAGRYHQFTRAAEVDVEGALVESLDSLGALDGGVAALSVATGDHVVAGLDQALTPGVRLGLQGYVKRFRGVAGPLGTRTSSGIDLRLQAGGPNRTGWMGYALNWTWEDEAGAAESRRFLGRHVMSAGYRGSLGGPLGVEVRLSFSDGLPLTEVPLDADSEALSPNRPTDLERPLGDDPALAGDADGFFRADLELYGEWDAPIGPGRIRPYLRVLNALDRRDALFYYFEPWRSPELTPLARRSVLPVIGVAWRF